MESYTKDAIHMLGRKYLVEIAIETLEEQIRYLDTELTSCRTSSLDTVRSGNGTFGAEEERRIKLLAKKDDANFRLRALYEETERIERGYAVLNPYQQDLLETFFVKHTKNCVEELAERHFKERSALYRDRKKALERFTLAVYGALTV